MEQITNLDKALRYMIEGAVREIANQEIEKAIHFIRQRVAERIPAILCGVKQYITNIDRDDAVEIKIVVDHNAIKANLKHGP